MKRLAVLAAGLLTACARYAPAPLDIGTAQDPVAPAIGESAAAGYTLDDIAALAVRRNPELVALRKQLEIADAQVFAAGLLPDPQVAASFDHPFDAIPGLVNAVGGTLSYELVALLTRPARRTAERQRAEQVRLDVVWQEWQVAQQARLAALRQLAELRRLQVLETSHALYADRYQRSRGALADGDLTLDVVGTDLTALLDMTTAINQAEQNLARTRQELNLLVGTTPASELVLAAMPDCATIAAEQVSGELATLAERRPDLLALQAGYASQESRLQAAILAQFPAISVASAGARDTGAVHTGGLSVALTLPLFSGNRGAIASERATRAALGEEFRARLAQAHADIATIGDLQRVVARQQQRLLRYLPTLTQFVVQGRRAYANADIDALTFLNMELTLTNKQLDLITLEQATCENRIALDTLLARFTADPAESAP